MLHIFLFILKTIGILLALILGILFTALLLVLFVPVKYRVEAKNEDILYARARLSWLLRFIFVRIQYQDNNIGFQVRILGFRVYDTDKPKDEEKVKRKKEKRLHRKRLKSKKLKEHNKKKNHKTNIEKIRRNQKKTDKELTEEHLQIESSNIAKSRLMVVTSSNRVTGIEHVMKYEEKVEEKISNIEEEIKEQEESLDNSEGIIDESVKKARIRILSKLRNYFVRIKQAILHVIQIIINIKKSGKNVKILIAKIIVFLQDEKNKSGIQIGFGKLRQVIKHILPLKYRLYLHFGTGDPCSTGEVLAALSCFYPLYAKSVQIVPNFEEKVIESNLYAKGRIRFISLLIISIKMIRDENVRYLINRIRNFKEES